MQIVKHAVSGLVAAFDDCREIECSRGIQFLSQFDTALPFDGPQRADVDVLCRVRDRHLPDFVGCV